MKVILYQTSRRKVNQGKVVKKIYETEIFEDDGTVDSGKMIAKFTEHEMAEEYAQLKGWEVTENQREDGK